MIEVAPESSVFELDPSKLKEFRMRSFPIMGTGIPGNIQQIQALRDCKQFLSDVLVNRDQPMDPAKLLSTVCRALGESGTDAQLIAQAGVDEQSIL